MATSRQKPRCDAESYRTPMPITHRYIARNSGAYLCPRCGIPLELEFIQHCYACGQWLDWQTCRDAIPVRIFVYRRGYSL